jgi:hypothetical protein
MLLRITRMCALAAVAAAPYRVPPPAAPGTASTAPAAADEALEQLSSAAPEAVPAALAFRGDKALLPARTGHTPQVWMQADIWAEVTGKVLLPAAETAAAPAASTTSWSARSCAKVRRGVA